MTAADNTTTQRWVGRPWAARLVRALVYLVPFVASVGVAFGLGVVVPPAHGVAWVVARFIAIALVSTVVLILVDRVTRRMLPLAALLDLTLLFPDQAPSRYKVALRASSATTLQKLLDEYRTTGANEPALAAERLLELVGALRDHDRLTRGHSERVRAYSQMIGEEMGMSGLELDRLRWAGLVHDIGKLRVDPAILNKPGKLTEDEFQQIKKHPEYGAVLAAPLARWLGDSVLAVSQHHERWDGRGYPYGLAGHEIALPARIVSVADTFDVMTSVRSYKSARTAVDAREELAKCAGSQFDPAVVRAFLNLSLGKLRVAMGPLSWLAQLKLFPSSLIGGAAAPAANAVAAFTGMAAATLGAAAAADLPHDTAPVTRSEAAVVSTTTMPPGPGAPVEVLPVDMRSVEDGRDPAVDASVPDGIATTSTTVLGAQNEEIAAPGVADATTTSTTARPGSSSTTTTVSGGRADQPTTTTRVPTSTVAPASGGPASSAPTTSAPRAPTTTVHAGTPSATTTTPTPVTTTTTTLPPATTTTTSTTTTTTTSTTTTTTTTVPGRLSGVFQLGSSAAGSVTSQEVLPLVQRSALNTGGLPNFDTDRDSSAGLWIRKGGALALGDPTRMQRFRLSIGTNINVQGAASVRLYVAPVGFLLDSMNISVALVECSGSSLDSCNVVASASKGFTGLLSLYQAVDVNLGVVNEGFSASHSLEVWVVANASSSKDLVLAYDTNSYGSALTLT